MQILFSSVRLLAFGCYCDLCVNLSTALAELYLDKNLPLNKKLLIKMSKFSEKNLIKWRNMEQRYINLCLGQGTFGL